MTPALEQLNLTGPSVKRFQSEQCVSTLKPIPNFPDYWASDEGLVYSTRRQWSSCLPRLLSMEKDDDGYYFVDIRVDGIRKRPKVHHLVALAFHGLPTTPAHETRHRDGTRTNNVPSNLVWGTRKDNADDRERHGRTAKGSRSGRARFSDDDVRSIRARIDNGELQRDLAREFAVHHSQISDLYHRRTYASVA